ncbi:MAG: ABC transporter substrate-binding protein [Deltaproteobacteria bacterium]|nr:ABC transporter substrate-binding protein [Deltaproteobacteria bacterium]
MKKVRRVIGLILLLLAGKPEAGFAKPVRIGCSGLGGLYLPVWVAQDRSFFRKHGLDTEVITFQGGPQTVQALVAGDIHFTVGGISSGVNARLAGADVLAVATFVNTLPYTLVATRRIKATDQLKGKRIAVSRFGAADHVALKIGLRKSGIDPEKETVLLQIGNQSARFGALQGGTADATLISPPLTLTARKLGFHSLLSFQKSGIRWAYNSILITNDFGQRHRETVVSFLKSFLEGMAHVLKHKEDSLAVLGKWMGLKDREALEESYNYLVESISRKPYTDPEGLQALLDLIREANPKAKKDPLQAFDDMSYLRELDRSGFIDRLYQ